MTTEKTTPITNIKTLLVNLPDDIKYLIVRDVFCVNDFLFEMEFFDLSKLTTALKHFFPQEFYYKKNNPLKTDKEKTQACWKKMFGRLTQIEQTIFYFVITDVEGTLQPTDIHPDNLKLILINYFEHQCLLYYFQQNNNEVMLSYCYQTIKHLIKTNPNEYFFRWYSTDQNKNEYLTLAHYAILCHQSVDTLQTDFIFDDIYFHIIDVEVFTEEDTFYPDIADIATLFWFNAIQTKHQPLLTYLLDNSEIDNFNIFHLIKHAIKRYSNESIEYLKAKLTFLSFNDQFSFLDTAIRSKQFYLASTIIDWHTDQINGDEFNLFFFSHMRIKRNMSNCYNAYYQSKIVIFYSKANVLQHHLANIEAVTCIHNIEQAFQHWINDLYNNDLDQETLALSKATLLQNIENTYRILSLKIKTKKLYSILYWINGSIASNSLFLLIFAIIAAINGSLIRGMVLLGFLNVINTFISTNIVVHIIILTAISSLVFFPLLYFCFEILLNWLTSNFSCIQKIETAKLGKCIFGKSIVDILMSVLFSLVFSLVIFASCFCIHYGITFYLNLLQTDILFLSLLPLSPGILTIISIPIFYYCFSKFEPNLHYHCFLDTVKDNISETSHFFDSYDDYASLIKQSNIDETFKENLLTQIQLIKQQICLLSKTKEIELDERFQLLQTSILNFKNQLQQIDQSSYHTGLVLLGAITVLTIAASIACLIIICSPEFLTTLSLWWQTNINLLAIASGCSAGISVTGFGSFYYYGRDPFIREGNALIKKADSYLEKPCNLPNDFQILSNADPLNFLPQIA